MDLKRFAQKMLAAFLLSMFCLVSLAQELTVSGLVLDNRGDPIIGANVKVVGNPTVGTITDFDGKFTLAVSSSDKQLEISYIGMQSAIVNVVAGKTLNITLKEDAEVLDEVVVIGYGTVRKKDLTGSVASVGKEALAANPVADVSQALQGKLAGVSVISQDGRPGAEVAIRVRGGGSISQSNDPLFVVDGFPVSSISDIPADQIVSIDVLKDAASTAIYGARGANGVILVTTKGADKDKISVTYSGYYQTKWAAKITEQMSAQDYILWNWGYATDYNATYAASLEKYFGLGIANGNHYDEYANMATHNYTDDLLHTASSWNHNLTVSGGNEKTKYTFSVNYMDDDGIKYNSGYKRLSSNFKLNQKFNKIVSFDMDVRYANTTTEGKDYAVSGGGSIVSTAYAYRPIDTPLGTDDPTLLMMGENNVSPSQNPISINNAIFDQTVKDNFRANFALNIEPLKGLKLRSELGVGKGWSKSKYYEDGSVNSGYTKGYKYAKLGKGENNNIRSVTTLNYDIPGLGDKQNMNVMVGYETIKSQSESSQMIGAGYPMGDAWDMDRIFGMMTMYDPSKTDNGYSNTVNAASTTQSVFGRLNYSLLDRYLLTVTLRADGSSKFGPSNRWGYFPAAALAWRVIDESFMESSRDWLDNLKLRLSYGTAGADNIDSNLWRETWKSGTVAQDGNIVPTYTPKGMKQNPDLKWETTISRNLGLDFGFLNNRVFGTIDFYWNTTKDLLMRQEIDSSTGYSYQYRNVGQTSNKGVELSLNYNIVRSNKFNLTLTATYNYNKNNVDELMDGTDIMYKSGWGSTPQQPNYDYILREGKPVGLIHGYVSKGFYSVDDFDYIDGIYKLKAGIPDIASQITTSYPRPSGIKVADGQFAYPGCLKVDDVTGDGIANTEDVTVIGEIQPKHTGGFSLSGNYKNFDFNANFAYQIGGKVYNATAMAQLMGGKDGGVGKGKAKWIKDTFKYYTVNNGELTAVTTPEELASLNAETKYHSATYEVGIVLSEFVENASYLRLSSLTLGYTLPKSWTKKAFIENARIYVTGGNLFCLSGYSGLDPEVNADPKKNDNYPTLGLDYGAYPRARTFTVGLNLQF
ncbi:TonB-dependent receptor [Phocaeicola vulgatus]|nr:TonB-dependent receptor [Phocaeicola vulgatus]